MLYLAAIVMPDADLSLAVPAVFFGSVGTGQHCTSTRRLYLHCAIGPESLTRLQARYTSPALVPVDLLNARTLLGPLHSRAALGIYDNAIADLKAAGAQILVGGGGEGVGGVGGRYEDLPPPLDRGNFVRPTIAIPSKVIRSTAKFPSRSAAAAAVVDVDDDHSGSLWATERFAPVLLVAEFEELEEAIAWNNAVPQGLSSSLWTRDLRHVGRWIGPAGSDTGIVNVSETLLSLSSPFVYFLLLGILLFRRSMSARAVQKLVLHSAGTRSVLHFCWDAVPLTLVVIRAPGGVVNPAATLGNNTYAGARARSTFPTRHPSRKASTLTRHEQTTSCPRSRQRINGRRASKRYYIFFCVCCHGGEETITGTYNSTRRKKKVIINHIYDAVREPT